MGIEVKPWPPRPEGVDPKWDPGRTMVCVMDPDGNARGWLPCPVSWEMRGDRHRATLTVNPSYVPTKALPCVGDVISVTASWGSEWERLEGREFVVVSETDAFHSTDGLVEIVLELTEKRQPPARRCIDFLSY